MILHSNAVLMFTMWYELRTTSNVLAIQQTDETNSRCYHHHDTHLQFIQMENMAFLVICLLGNVGWWSALHNHEVGKIIRPIATLDFYAVAYEMDEYADHKKMHQTILATALFWFSVLLCWKKQFHLPMSKRTKAIHFVLILWYNVMVRYSNNGIVITKLYILNLPCVFQSETVMLFYIICENICLYCAPGCQVKVLLTGIIVFFNVKTNPSSSAGQVFSTMKLFCSRKALRAHYDWRLDKVIMYAMSLHNYDEPWYSVNWKLCDYLFNSINCIPGGVVHIVKTLSAFKDAVIFSGLLFFIVLVWLYLGLIAGTMVVMRLVKKILLPIPCTETHTEMG